MITYMEHIKISENLETTLSLDKENVREALILELKEVLQLDPRAALKRVAQMGRTIKNLVVEEGVIEVVFGTSPQLRFGGTSTGNKFTLQTKEAGTYTIEYAEDAHETLLFQNGKKIEEKSYDQALEAIMSSLSEMSVGLIRINHYD